MAYLLTKLISMFGTWRTWLPSISNARKLDMPPYRYGSEGLYLLGWLIGMWKTHQHVRPIVCSLRGQMLISMLIPTSLS